MVEFHGLRTVIYPARDLAASRAWWTDFLGREPYFDEPFYVGFNVSGYELGLVPDSRKADDGALAYWAVDDVDQAVNDAMSRGAALHGALADVGAGIVTGSVTLLDGSIVGFIDNPHFSLE